MTLTELQRKTLTYLREHDRAGVKAAEIAAYLWPDSVMHRKTSNQGHGACRGKAAWLCGGSYLSKLAKRGWVYWTTTRGVEMGAYYITSEGQKVLREVEQDI